MTMRPVATPHVPIRDPRSRQFGCGRRPRWIPSIHSRGWVGEIVVREILDRQIAGGYRRQSSGMTVCGLVVVEVACGLGFVPPGEEVDFSANCLAPLTVRARRKRKIRICFLLFFCRLAVVVMTYDSSEERWMRTPRER